MPKSKKKKIGKINKNEMFVGLLYEAPLRAIIYILSMKVDEIIEVLNKAK